jgi:hypothetical protein
MNPFPKGPPEPSNEEQHLMQLLQQNPALMEKYQEELTRMQALNKSSHAPMSSQEYLAKLPEIDRHLDSEGGLTISPSAAFVLKFAQKQGGEKLFVNVVTHEAIDSPEERLLVDCENQPGLRIPMSMGTVREDFDKSTIAITEAAVPARCST